ncbi:MAG: hypothetical protein LBT34_02665 [Clostridiales Family XIII bacterium]|jgi:hypothetical protein|nr:hypothetical protein [Clostridiales Family XIII bacterium]
MVSATKMYLDDCRLNRPYADLREGAERMESEAVVAIIDRLENGEWEFCGYE